MRLIDADAFRRELDKHYPFTKEEQSKHGIADIAKSVLLSILMRMPTIEERKKGQWRNIQIGEWLGVECTACKIAHDWREVPHVNGGGVAWYFCPECGADMRGEGNGNE